MPDLLTCVTMLAKILTLSWSFGGWIGVAIALRCKDGTLESLGLWDRMGVVLGTPSFVGLMGWLD